MHVLVTVPGAAGDELLTTDAWIGGAIGVEELGDDLRVAFDDPGAAASFAELTGGDSQPVADDTGLDAWRAHAETYEAGPFVIRPPWLRRTDSPELVIDPGRTFGSGSHASTRLALELLSDRIERLSPARSAPQIADIGCGSGVLAIAAAVLGARCVAVDINEAAVEATTLNAAANDVTDRVSVRSGSALEARGEYDLAVVNVTIDIHETIAAEVREHVHVGRLIVAGILAGDQERRAAAAYDARVVERRQQGEWAGLLLHLNE